MRLQNPIHKQEQVMMAEITEDVGRALGDWGGKATIKDVVGITGYDEAQVEQAFEMLILQGFVEQQGEYYIIGKQRS